MAQSAKGQGSANKVYVHTKGDPRGRAELILPTWRALGDLWGLGTFRPKSHNQCQRMSLCGAQ